MQWPPGADRRLGNRHPSCTPSLKWRSGSKERTLKAVCMLCSHGSTQFWERVEEWCRGSTMLADRSCGARQPCPVCGKVVRVHATGRVNAHFAAEAVEAPRP